MMTRLRKTRPYRTAVGLLTLALTWTTFTPAHASVPDCEALARTAGLETDLPWELLPAIARVESGIDMGNGARTAWPWTLNEGGQSRYFKTREEALAYLKDAVARGVTNIDVGCMQINYRWHGDKFRTLADMLDPEQNTAYGAMYLSNLNRHLDDWAAA
ncbi:MAG: transglycosylase SLT domain-containing protein, partial [Pseudomonadota bacterium]|nr:transglycosylase SLT domain-containing protein [Pseudomonadota bacterium]